MKYIHKLNNFLTSNPVATADHNVDLNAYGIESKTSAFPISTFHWFIVASSVAAVYFLRRPISACYHWFTASEPHHYQPVPQVEGEEKELASFQDAIQIQEETLEKIQTQEEKQEESSQEDDDVESNNVNELFSMSPSPPIIITREDFTDKSETKELGNNNQSGNSSCRIM